MKDVASCGGIGNEIFLFLSSSFLITCLAKGRSARSTKLTNIWGQKMDLPEKLSCLILIDKYIFIGRKIMDIIGVTSFSVFG